MPHALASTGPRGPRASRDRCLGGHRYRGTPTPECCCRGSRHHERLIRAHDFCFVDRPPPAASSQVRAPTWGLLFSFFFSVLPFLFAPWIFRFGAACCAGDPFCWRPAAVGLFFFSHLLFFLSLPLLPLLSPVLSPSFSFPLVAGLVVDLAVTKGRRGRQPNQPTRARKTGPDTTAPVLHAIREPVQMPGSAGAAWFSGWPSLFQRRQALGEGVDRDAEGFGEDGEREEPGLDFPGLDTTYLCAVQARGFVQLGL